MYLTKRQHEILKFLLRFIKQNGYSPTLQEICDGTGLSSIATAHKHLKNLEKRGAITRKCNCSRSIELDKNINLSNAVELRVLGEVSRGRPIEAMKKTFVSVPNEFVKSADAYILKVKDDSFREETFLCGDLLIVERRNIAENGEYVVAVITRESAIIRGNPVRDAIVIGRYYRDASSVRIESANPQWTPLVMPECEVQLRGVIVGLMRQY